MICSPQYYSGDQIKQNGLGGTRSTDGARRGAYRLFFFFFFFWWGHLKLGDQSSDPRVDGRVTLKWIFKKWDGDMDGIDQARDRGRWQAPVNA